jgi:class 3 adenylate cyclase
MADDIAAWLDGLGMGAYAAAFEANDVDLRALPHLDQGDLKELGVSLGHRKVILAAIAGLAAPAPEPADRSEAERRQLTVMFVDLVGSTDLSGRLDPEEMRDVITGYQNTVAGVVTRFEGHVAKYMGDGVLCYFGWPTAHEDDAERAARAGLAVMSAMTGMTAPNGEPLAARAGIATGLVVVGDLVGEGAAQEEAVVGATPNLAARVQGLAQPGQVVVAEATRRLLGDVFDLTDLGVHDLKGVAGQTPAFAVAGERAAESRFEARSTAAMAAMVGRDNELSLIRDRWIRAEAGEGQLVLLTGEAGIGKSRITRAVVDAVAEAPHVRVSYQCSPYHTDSSLYPAIQQLGHAAGFQPGDSNDDRLDRLEGVATPDAAPLLAALMGLDGAARYGPLGLAPAEQRARTLQALVDQLLALARGRPVLFVLEDAHWIDATTLEMIDLCLDQIEDARVLLLVTARPSFDHGFGGHPIVTRLTLNRLGREQIRAIVAKLTHGKALPEELMEVIAAKTDGVPLFIEELTKTVLESGDLTETKSAFTLNGPLSRLAIPATLHDSLMARLDRLQPVKEVAQMAACIGREFDHALLGAISPLDDAALAAALDRLVAAELIFRRGAGADARYIFKHALVRDTAYESLLKTRRQALHARLLDALEARGDAAPEILGHHASAANLHEAAFGYWRRAGDAAFSRPAYHEASTHATNALAEIARMNDPAKWRRAEVETQLRLAQACMIRDGYTAPSAQTAFARARDLMVMEEDRDLFMPIHYGMWVGHYLKAEFPEGRALAERLLPEVERLDDPVARLTAHRMIAATLIGVGEPESAARHLEIAEACYSPDMRIGFETRFAQELGVQINCYIALSAWLLGKPDAARRVIENVCRVSDEIEHVNTIAYGQLHRAIIGACARNQDEMRESFGLVSLLADRHEMAIWKFYAHAGAALQASRDGDPEALDRARRHIKARRLGIDRLFLPLFLMMQGEEELRLGEPDAAETTLRDAFAIRARTEEAWSDPELHRLSGQIALARGRTEAAEAAFRKAVEIAYAQQSLSFELRSALALANLLHGAGRDAEARAALAPTHGRFTEGFDMPDFKAAAGLLARLDG